MKIANEQVEGIGFAIPSNEVKVTIKELVKTEKSTALLLVLVY